MRHKFDPKILKAYDIRGIYGENLHTTDAFAVGRCFGMILRDRGKLRVCIGRDGRLSSPELEQALVKGLIQCGVDVIRVGLVTTPALYFAEYNLEADGAIMVTASHNPPEYNGFKMTLEKRSFFGEDIQNFGVLASQGAFANGEGTVIDIPILSKYVSYVQKDFLTFYQKNRPLNIIWDCGNGATGVIIHELVHNLPGTHVILNDQVDPTFPAHEPDPTIPENLTQLMSEVRKRKADLGIAFDGDGDRLSVVDSEGVMLWGDQLLLLYADEVLQQHPGASIIGDIKVSQACFDTIETMGGHPVMTKTGHSFIKHKIKETGALLAGEMSGHMFFCDRYFGYDDAAYAALRAIGIISGMSKSLASWRKELKPIINTPEINIPCDNEQKIRVVDMVLGRMKHTPAKVIDIDGIRVVYPYGWWLLRASNTSEKLVVRAEAESLDDLRKLLDDLQFQLTQVGVVADFQRYTAEKRIS